jgi:hypothetical protein
VKTLLCLIALLAIPVAHAETITLGSEACTSTNICYNVPNDSGATVDYISNATQYKRLVVSIDGNLYDSGLWTVTSLQDVPLYDPSGAVIYVTLNFSVKTKPCVRSGRVTVCPRFVELTGGTIQH